MKILFKSFLAGIMIAIGGTVFLSIENKVIGASLFSIGLFGVLIYNLNLYTGKIGYLITNFNLKYIKELIITNTVPLTPEKQTDKIKVLSIAPLFAEAIKRVNEAQPLGDLFDFDK